MRLSQTLVGVLLLVSLWTVNASSEENDKDAEEKNFLMDTENVDEEKDNIYEENDFNLGVGEFVDVVFDCLGHIKTGLRYLDGRTSDNNVVLVNNFQSNGETKFRVKNYGSYVTLQCLASGRFVFGDTSNGAVVLNPDENALGAHWRMGGNSVKGYSFYTLNANKDPNRRFMGGNTVGGSVVLVPSGEGGYTGSWWNFLVPETGARMMPRPAPAPVQPPVQPNDQEDNDLDLDDGEEIEILLNNLGHIKTQYKYLDGRTADNTVGLAPSFNAPYIGTVWKLKNWGSYVTLVCVVNGRYLFGDATKGSVGLTPDADHSGTHWRLGGSRLRGYSFYLIGSDQTNFKYLDGRTVEGTVGLAPHRLGGYTGTWWQFLVPGTGSLYVRRKRLPAPRPVIPQEPEQPEQPEQPEEPEQPEQPTGGSWSTIHRYRYVYPNDDSDADYGRYYRYLRHHHHHHRHHGHRVIKYRTTYTVHHGPAVDASN